MQRHLIPKVVGAAVLLAALGGGVASAFTAGNNVPVTLAGEGVGAVSGYNISNVHYTLVQAQGQYDKLVDIGGVSFSLDNPASAGSVGYGLYNSANQTVGGGACTATDNTMKNWTCTAQSPNGYAAVGEVYGLDVFAAS